MNDFGEQYYSYPYCYFHPREAIVGICALCLKEKLLVLASKQGRLPLPTAKESHAISFIRVPSCKKIPAAAIPYKVFALGSSFLHRLDSRHEKPGDESGADSVPNLDDSFISIKFEDNGQSSWDKKIRNPNQPIDGARCNNQLGLPSNVRDRSVGEHGKQPPRGGGGNKLRWRKRIGDLFQLVRRRRRSSVCHVGIAGKVGGVKVRKGLIRSLTKRTTAE